MVVRPQSLTWRRLSPMGQRLLLWLGWPALVVICSVAVIHFLRYRLGVDVFWRWEATPMLLFAAAILIPLLLHEARRR
jgi:hypothetical protein